MKGSILRNLFKLRSRSSFDEMLDRMKAEFTRNMEDIDYFNTTYVEVSEGSEPNIINVDIEVEPIRGCGLATLDFNILKTGDAK